MRPHHSAEADAEADALLVDALQGAVCAAREPAEVLCSRENGAARMGLVRMDQPELLSSATHRAHAKCAPPPRWREDEAFALCALSRSFAPLRPTPALEPELEKAPEGHAATR